MGYVERILQPGERVVHLSRLHWVVLLPGLLLILLAIAALPLYGGPNGGRPIVLVFIAAVLAWGIAALFSAWLRRWTTEIAVTDRRIIYKRGLIRRHTIEMNMDKVESVDVDQSILGRVLDYGTITVRGTGSGIEPLANIDSPIELRNHVTAR